MKKFFGYAVAVAMLAGVSFAAETTVKGVISDEHCGAKGAKGDHAACAEKCIKGGAAPVFVSEDGKVWKITNPDSVKGHYGHSVEVKGTPDEKTSSIQIASVTMPKADAKADTKKK